MGIPRSMIVGSSSSIAGIMLPGSYHAAVSAGTKQKDPRQVVPPEVF